jgi:GNAT superfamily N-acetyltransferase
MKLIDSSELLVSPLSREFDREGFSCGVEELDTFLKQLALRHQKQGFSTTWVVHVANSRTVFGYYCLSSASIVREEWPAEVSKKWPRHPVPCTLIGRLATHSSVRGKGIGSFLLRDALDRIISLSDQVGVASVIVDAKDEEVAEFYRKFGFLNFPGDDLRLFIPIKTLKQARRQACADR